MTTSRNLRPRRSQFVLGPDAVRTGEWQSIRLDNRHVLSFDADLTVCRSTGEDCTVTLLGFVLDWADPDAGNEQILGRLTKGKADFQSCLELCADFGGRWILVFQDSQAIKVFHDASGLRQVCYTVPDGGKAVFCASQPKLLAEVAGLEEDGEALDFIDRQASKNPEYWWPGNRLPYVDARALLPNHVLDLRTGHVERYWPVAPDRHDSYEQHVDRAGKILQGSFLAASRRFDLALGLSAGWDSRVLLAASRRIQDGLTAYTAVADSMSREHPDVAVPLRISNALRLDHRLVHHPATASDEFQSTLSRHTWRPHGRFVPGMQAEYEAYRQSRVAVIGNVAEVLKCPYRNQVQTQQSLSGELLAQLIGMSGEDFAIRALDDWLAGVPSGTGYAVLDLFYWEQRLGRWLAANCIEFDFVWKDVCIPFNCRALIRELLACDEQKRQMRRPEIFLEMMNRLWPAVVDFPINPEPRPRLRVRIRRRKRRILALFGLR